MSESEVKEILSRLKSEESSHVFRVRKVYLCNEDENFTSMHGFRTNVPTRVHWMWKLRCSDDNSISVTLYLVDWDRYFEHNEFPTVNISISVIHVKDGNVLHKLETKHAFDDQTSFECKSFYKIQEDILEEDELKILCEYKYFDQRETNVPGSTEMLQLECTETLSKDLASLHHDPKFSDFTLWVGQKEFPSHRNILSARSPVFKAMFECDMKEKNQNKVEIKDIKPEIMKEMLEFIYTGKTPNLEEMAQDLLVAADRFSLLQLKTLAEVNLAGKLCVTTAMDQLIFADTYSATRLKKEATDFIVANIDKIRKTEGWRQMVNNKPKLMDLILTGIYGESPQK